MRPPSSSSPVHRDCMHTVKWILIFKKELQRREELYEAGTYWYRKYKFHNDGKWPVTRWYVACVCRWSGKMHKSQCHHYLFYSYYIIAFHTFILPLFINRGYKFTGMLLVSRADVFKKTWSTKCKFSQTFESSCRIETIFAFLCR